MDPTVLLIDEEKLPLKHYIQVLKNTGFKALQCYDTDKCLELIERGIPDLVAILLDVMMPPGRRFAKEETQNGLITGVLLYKEIRRLCPDVPVIVLTNVSDAETLKYLKEDRLTKIVQKLNYPPFRLARLINETVSGKSN